MVRAEGHADGTGSRGDRLAHFEAIAGALEYGHGLRAVIHDRDHVALRLDAAGVAADAAFTLRGNRVKQVSAGIVNQKLVGGGGVGSRNHQGVLIGSGLNGGSRRYEREQYAKYAFAKLHCDLLKIS